MAKPSKSKTDVVEEQILRWPDGWPRQRVGAWRTSRSDWRKKSISEHKKSLVNELELMGAASILITRSPNERDPGVAVWFSMAKDTEAWQDTLGIENPLPTLDEINQAFKLHAKEVHPDRPDGKGDIGAYQRLVAARDAAKEWVLGTHQQNHEFVMALDQFDTPGANMAGLRLAFANLRSLKRLGMPTILERTLNKAFKAALPMNAGEGQK